LVQEYSTRAPRSFVITHPILIADFAGEGELCARIFRR
jgi:hypothetical protein